MFDRRQMIRAGVFVIQAATWAGAAHAETEDLLAACIASGSRDAHDRQRDVYRHPEQTLRFWGLTPGAAVIEVQPGRGWWTDILAPYLAKTHGRYIAADLSDPGVSQEERRAHAAFERKYVGHPSIYGSVEVVGFGTTTGPLAPVGSVDLVIVSRETHNWVQNGFIKKAFREFYTALKPGGVLGIEDHRAAKGADPAADSGYIPEAYVIAEAEAAGFKLAARSDLNANPADTKDHPFGVWTLPPTRRSAPKGSPSNPAFDHSKFDRIGESDRMTLKFVKP